MKRGSLKETSLLSAVYNADIGAHYKSSSYV